MKVIVHENIVSFISGDMFLSSSRMHENFLKRKCVEFFHGISKQKDTIASSYLNRTSEVTKNVKVSHNHLGLTVTFSCHACMNLSVEKFESYLWNFHNEWLLHSSSRFSDWLIPKDYPDGGGDCDWLILKTIQLMETLIG